MFICVFLRHISIDPCFDQSGIRLTLLIAELHGGAVLIWSRKSLVAFKTFVKTFLTSVSGCPGCLRNVLFLFQDQRRLLFFGSEFSLFVFFSFKQIFLTIFRELLPNHDNIYNHFLKIWICFIQMQRFFKKFSKLNNFLHGDSRIYFNLFEGDPQLCCCFFSVQLI